MFPTKYYGKGKSKSGVANKIFITADDMSPCGSVKHGTCICMRQCMCELH